VARLTDDTPVPAMARFGLERARSAEPRRKQKREELDGKEGIGLPPWKHEFGGHGTAVQRKILPRPYREESEGESMRTGRRRFRQSWRQTQLENGTAVAKLGAGGPSGGVRWREL
jgi:hypothetical protein